MVPVALHHGGDVPFPPVREPEMIVKRVFRTVPHVERFIHNDHTDPVAYLEQRQRRRIVRDTDRVEARFLQSGQLPFLRRRKRRRAEHAMIVVDTAAAQLHRLAVQ